MPSDTRGKQRARDLAVIARLMIFGGLLIGYLLFLYSMLPGQSLETIFRIDVGFANPMESGLDWAEVAWILRQLCVLGLQLLMVITLVFTVWNVLYGIGRILRPRLEVVEHLGERKFLMDAPRLVTEEYVAETRRSEEPRKVKIHGNYQVPRDE